MHLRRYLICFCLILCAGIFTAASEQQPAPSGFPAPQDADGYYRLASFFMTQKAYLEVIAMIDEAEAKGVKNAALYQIQAEAAFLLGNTDEAMLALAKIEKLGQ